mmetsp:Transcript_46520/g.80173  ORF Transcript_46520/g.80173 Transcript_46520/m.80173 type:complete len:207 (-) Transcript_46520:187-807(-)
MAGLLNLFAGLVVLAAVSHAFVASSTKSLSGPLAERSDVLVATTGGRTSTKLNFIWPKRVGVWDSMYEKLGGEQAIQKIINHFYVIHVLQDTWNSSFLETADISLLLNRSKDFLRYITGGSSENTSGLNLYQSLRAAGMHPLHWLPLKKHFFATLISLNVETQDVKRLLDQVSPSKEEKKEHWAEYLGCNWVSEREEEGMYELQLD